MRVFRIAALGLDFLVSLLALPLAGVAGALTAGTITQYPLPAANAGPNSIVRGPGGNLWFTELIGNEIGRMTPTGTLTQFRIPSFSSLPEGITFGPDGNLWFAEARANRIGRITPPGAHHRVPGSVAEWVWSH